MEPASYRISLNMNVDAVVVSLGVRRGDTARRIYINLTEDGKPYTIAEGCYAVFSGKKPDGTALFNNCVIDRNTIIYDLTPQTTNVKGRIKCEVRLYSSDDRLITSNDFEIIVHDTVLNPQEEIGSVTEVGALDHLISEATAKIAEIVEATEEGEAAAVAANHAAEAANGAAADANAASERADTSAEAADEAVKNAECAADSANAAAEAAQTVAARADTAGRDAQAAAQAALDAAQQSWEQAQIAGSAAENANTAAERAGASAKNADAATDDANIAADAANYEAQAATVAAAAATSAAEGANQAAGVADAQAERAGTSADEADAAAQRANAIAAELENREYALINDTKVGTDAWSSKNTVDRLCPAFSEKGVVVTCNPVEGYPLQVVSNIVPVQTGSGDPSPDNIRPITGYTAVHLTRCGKNLWGGDALANCIVAAGGTKDEATGTVMFNPGTVDRRAIRFDRFKENTQYTFILYGRNTDAVATSFNMRITYTDGTIGASNVGNNFPDPITVDHYWCFTTPIGKSIQSLAALWENGSTVLYYDKCGIFEGAVPLEEFEAYKGDTFAADFGRIVYGGSYDWQSGVLKEDRKLKTFDGTEGWIFVEITKETNYFVCKLEDTATGNLEGPICSHFPNRKISSATTDIGFSLTHSAYMDRKFSVLIRPDLNVINDLAAWKAFLAEQYAAGTPVQVCCRAAEPKTVQVAQQMIPALSDTNLLFSDTGDTEVTGRADPLTVIGNQQEQINRILDRVAALEAAAVSNT